MILFVLILAALSFWVYADAKARNARQPVLWAVGTLLLAIAVVPIWFLRRPQKLEDLVPTAITRRCPSCAEHIQAAAIKCRFCGSTLDPFATASVWDPDSIGTIVIHNAPRRLSGGRVVVKTCHLLAIAWTVLCIVGVLAGVVNVGVSTGLAFWAFAWFVPVVGLEVVVLAVSASSRQIPLDDVTSKREWRRAFWISAIPNVVAVFAVVSTL
jgi:hypothetical protein